MSSTPTVLIVEDEPVFRRIMSFTIANYGFRVETTSNGNEGFDRLVQGGIDFLVTDLQMPACTGLELIEKADATEGMTRPPTILCTAKGLELDTTKLMREKGLIAIMHKPFSPRKLGELIQQAFSEQAKPEPKDVVSQNESVNPIAIPPIRELSAAVAAEVSIDD